MQITIPEIQTTILSIFGTVIMPFVYKLLRSREFRQHVKIGIAKLWRNFIGTDVLNHYIFQTSKLYLSIAERTKFREGCQMKDALFKLLLTTFIGVFIEDLSRWLKKNQSHFGKMNIIDLQISMYKLIAEIQDKYEFAIANNFYILLENREKSTEVFKIIYHGTEENSDLGFKTFNDRNFKSLNEYIDNIHLYIGMSNKQLVNAFASEIDSVLRTSVRTVYKVFESKNGRLCK
jgi:hypothetical protein